MKTNESKTAFKVKALAPLVYKGTALTLMYRCSECMKRIDPEDDYCRWCGRELIGRPVWPIEMADEKQRLAIAEVREMLKDKFPEKPKSEPKPENEEDVQTLEKLALDKLRMDMMSAGRDVL